MRLLLTVASITAASEALGLRLPAMGARDLTCGTQIKENTRNFSAIPTGDGTHVAKPSRISRIA
jgi:hypothetical protein